MTCILALAWICHLMISLKLNKFVLITDSNMRGFGLSLYITKLKTFIFAFYFLACMPGYNGANCSIPCPYPYFGNQCQQMCTCIKDLCDVTSGCQHVNRGIFTLVHFFSIKQCIGYYTKIFLQNECIIQCETIK